VPIRRLSTQIVATRGTQISRPVMKYFFTEILVGSLCACQ